MTCAQHCVCSHATLCDSCGHECTHVRASIEWVGVTDEVIPHSPVRRLNPIQHISPTEQRGERMFCRDTEEAEGEYDERSSAAFCPDDWPEYLRNEWYDTQK